VAKSDAALVKRSLSTRQLSQTSRAPFRLLLHHIEKRAAHFSQETAPPWLAASRVEAVVDAFAPSRRRVLITWRRRGDEALTRNREKHRNDGASPRVMGYSSRRCVSDKIASLTL
jgi:hypothetical protein